VIKDFVLVHPSGAHFLVTRLSPARAVGLVGPGTVLRVVLDKGAHEDAHEGTTEGAHTYAQTELVERLRELVVAPLVAQGARHAMGLISGVLLCGPPGSGKTKSVRALEHFCAHLLPIRVVDVNLAEVMAAADPAEALRATLVRAEGGPADGLTLVVMDEADALGARPAQSTDVQAGIKALLGSFMDGLRARRSTGGGYVCVVATTNRPDEVDPSLRRGGRLEIEVPAFMLSTEDRARLLLELLSASDCGLVDEELSAAVRTVAECSGGYLPADLKGLVAEAQDIWRGGAGVADALVRARELVRPSALRGVQAVQSTMEFADIVGQEEAKLALHRAFRQVMASQAAQSGSVTVNMFKVGAMGGILLHGPPGNSKSRLAQAAARHYNLPMICLTSADVYSPYVGDAEAAVRHAFARARQTAPCVLFFDELDAIVTNRGGDDGGGGGTGTESRVLASMLNEMDGVSSKDGAGGDGVIVLAASNRVDAIDAALLRKGRFQRLICVDAPTAPEQHALLDHFASRFGLHDPAVRARLADELASRQSCSGADVENICKEEALAVVRALD
jgi:SpoVK/Ycf46/Vps4 family AAA+-type ATPase